MMSTTTTTDGLPAIHPGEFLREEIEGRGWTTQAFALKARIPHATLSKLLRGKRPVDDAVATRLGRALRTSAEYWLRLQALHDQRIARDEARP